MLIVDHTVPTELLPFPLGISSPHSTEWKTEGHQARPTLWLAPCAIVVWRQAGGVPLRDNLLPLPFCVLAELSFAHIVDSAEAELVGTSGNQSLDHH